MGENPRAWVRPSVRASMKGLIRTRVNIYLSGEPKARCWIGMLSIPITRSILGCVGENPRAWVRPSVQASMKGLIRTRVNIYLEGEPKARCWIGMLSTVRAGSLFNAIFFLALSKSKFDMNQTRPQIV